MHDDHSQHAHPKYALIFGALCVFTLISIMADVVELSYAVKVIAVLSVATCKALCVLAWFMHLKFERAWKYVLLAPTTILALGLPLALMPDVGEHYYTQEVPQLNDYAEHQARADAHHAEAKPEH
ncbi:MAG: cytochrome C oxidase subunit IV family protein [Planctomycetaceae bacterium]